MENKETYKVKNYMGESYDSGIPIELVDALSKLKEKMDEVSNGKYYCTPFIYSEDLKGISVGIVEVKNDGIHTKTPFYLTIK